MTNSPPKPKTSAGDDYPHDEPQNNNQSDSAPHSTHNGNTSSSKHDNDTNNLLPSIETNNISPLYLANKSISIAGISEKSYHKLSERIVGIVEKYLTNTESKKAFLRKIFAIFFSILLGVQFLFLILFILLNSFEAIQFTMSENILQMYIVSVFVETLGAIGVMLAFSFSTKEESTIVEVLTDVITHYQKYKAEDYDKTRSNEE